MTLPSPAYQGTQEGGPTVEGLMALVEQYVDAQIKWWDRKGPRASSDGIRSYAERLSRPHSETQQPSDGGKA